MFWPQPLHLLKDLLMDYHIIGDLMLLILELPSRSGRSRGQCFPLGPSSHGASSGGNGETEANRMAAGEQDTVLQTLKAAEAGFS
ncbi:hypothetical protein Q8A67_021815 [Cirrhinus molitorella]|uniref:Uncharacterized protein n=1 Tax=Cirrhinus molitorella TaxID=172907 RepID=A0AA88TGE7_9TELE|nr:hypothetical protein Q8A67_021815 [Cirrhinus molitorella]